MFSKSILEWIPGDQCLWFFNTIFLLGIYETVGHGVSFCVFAIRKNGVKQNHGHVGSRLWTVLKLYYSIIEFRGHLS